jgi:hypothetical protein
MLNKVTQACLPTQEKGKIILKQTC